MKSPEYSTKSDDFRTPKDLFDFYDAEFGFTLDAAASDVNHLCDMYFTIADNGLEREWNGHIVWVNPPYSNREYPLKAWVKKAYEESLNGVTSTLLIPAATNCNYWWDYIFPHAEIRYIKGRPAFYDVGKARHVHLVFPTALVIFRPC